MDNKAEAPAKKGMRGLLVWILLALVTASAGAALPWFVLKQHPDEHTVKKTASVEQKKTAIPFGEVTVNLGEEKLHRYLKVKLLVGVEESEAKEMGELLTQKKAFLKDWLIRYLFAQSFDDVGRRLGVNRISREIREQFNAILYPNGEEKILEILFDEFVVQ